MKLSRRNLLRSTVGATLTLPWLEAFAQTAAAPKRLVLFYSANGFRPGKWKPTVSGSTLTLGDTLSPLSSFKDQLVLIDNLDLTAAKGQNHPDSSYAALSGTSTTGSDHSPGGISIDQAVASHIGTTTRFRSLELGVQVAWYPLCASGPGQLLPMENSPYQAFNRVFAGLTGTTPAVDWQKQRRLKVLDGALGDLRALKARLGAADAARLDAHQSSIDDLERRLNATAPTVAASCGPPTLGTAISPTANDNFPTIGKLQMDVAAAALACDLTRVVTLQWSDPGSYTVHRWLGHTSDHHAHAHAYDQGMDDINKWYASQLAYFLGKLAAVPEGNGTLLDNTLVVWVPELGDAASHDTGDTPWVLAGKAGGALTTGRYLHLEESDWGGTTGAHTPHNRLLVSILRMFGIAADTFGDPSLGSGGLSGL